MKPVAPKKHLGQHFLTAPDIAQKIADTLLFENYQDVLEIGPGTGVLTQFLIPKTKSLKVVELDRESIDYLHIHYPSLEGNIINADFLKLDLKKLYGDRPLAIIGNFPYNISTQIVFRVLENRTQIPFFSGMFQKEVGERICEPPGSKKYGILSVLTQLFYEASYCFTVKPGVFNPPPKVDSGVIQLKRKEDFLLPCNEALLFRVVKTSFQQRRKTLRNSLKSFGLTADLTEDSIFDLRPEKLSCDAFIALTQKIENGQFSN
jgi:16S rRNA (adenine1518-N6/adenine1519-N6)-dimethyltransferase